MVIKFFSNILYRGGIFRNWSLWWGSINIITQLYVRPLLGQFCYDNSMNFLYSSHSPDRSTLLNNHILPTSALWTTIWEILIAKSILITWITFDIPFSQQVVNYKYVIKSNLLVCWFMIWNYLCKYDSKRSEWIKGRRWRLNRVRSTELKTESIRRNSVIYFKEQRGFMLQYYFWYSNGTRY